MTIEASAYDEWIGRTESTSDFLTLAPLKGMAATLDKEQLDFHPGDVLPPLWHWLYFLSPARQSKIAKDGHAERGDFLPPIPLPRRMWAGSRFEFHRPLHAGEKVSRESRIKNISVKAGRSGQLAFVTVKHKSARSWNRRSVKSMTSYIAIMRLLTPSLLQQNRSNGKPTIPDLLIPTPSYSFAIPH